MMIKRRTKRDTTKFESIISKQKNYRIISDGNVVSGDTLLYLLSLATPTEQLMLLLDAMEVTQETPA